MRRARTFLVMLAIAGMLLAAMAVQTGRVRARQQPGLGTVGEGRR